MTSTSRRPRGFLLSIALTYGLLFVGNASADPFGDLGKAVGGVVSGVTDGLTEFNRRRTEEAAEANRRTTEEAAEANRRATAEAAEFNRRRTEEGAEANRLAAAEVAEFNRRRTEEAAEANRLAAAEMAEFNRRRAEEAAALNRKITEEAAKTNQAVTTELAKTNKDITEEVKRAAEKAEQLKKDAQWNLQKALDDTKAETGRVAGNLQDAAQAIGQYLEHQMSSTVEVLNNAERRFREGKVVDALWHLGTDPLQSTSKNAAIAAQESAYLNTVAQVGAAAYGGPQGAAAYAAWLTYNQTGNADLALRAGILSFATSVAFKAAGELEALSFPEVARKAAITASIGGLAVAAAGGNEAAIREGFFKAGAMVLVQDGYRRVTGSSIDGRASEGEAYCMAAQNEKCSPPPEAYVRDAKGTIVTDSNGHPVIDMSKVDPRIPHVGKFAGATDVKWYQERSAFMTSVSKVPGMNAMALFHDQWSISWDMGSITNPSTIIPAIVITYTGTGAPYYELLQRSIAAGAPKIDVQGVNEVNATPVVSGNVATPANANPTPAGARDLVFSTNAALMTALCSTGERERSVIVEATEPNGTKCRTLSLYEGGAKVIQTGDKIPTCLSAAKQLIEGLSKEKMSCFSRDIFSRVPDEMAPMELRAAVNEGRGRAFPTWSLRAIGIVFLALVVLVGAAIGYGMRHVQHTFAVRKYSPRSV